MKLYALEIHSWRGQEQTCVPFDKRELRCTKGGTYSPVFHEFAHKFKPMILLPSCPPRPHLHPHPVHHLQLAEAETGRGGYPRTMPESGDIEVLSAARHHLASRRRFELKLDLASALSGRQRGEKKPRLELLNTSAALLTSKLSSTVTCGSCLRQQQTSEDSPPENGDCQTCMGHTTCTFRPIAREEDGRTSSNGHCPSSGGTATVRTVTPAELASKLGKSRTVLVIDCRPFLRYNEHHVQGALNISCTDRFNRKRLQQGKVGVLELLAATHGREHVRRRPVRDVVLYDDRGTAGMKVEVGEEEGDSAVHIVLATLHREGRQPLVLEGQL